MKLVRLVFAAGLVVCSIAPTSLAGFAVIGNPNLSLNHLTQTEIKRLYMQRSTSIDKDANLQVLNQPDSAAVKKQFYQKIFHWSLEQLSSYWSHYVFTGQGSPPPIVNSDKNAIAVVAGTPGTIGYIDSSAIPMAQGQVKVLYQDDAQNSTMKTTESTTANTLKSQAIAISKALKKLTSAKKTTREKATKLEKKSAKTAQTHKTNPVKSTQLSKKQRWHWSDFTANFSFQMDANLTESRMQIIQYLQQQQQLVAQLHQAAPYFYSDYKVLKQYRLPPEFALYIRLVKPVGDVNKFSRHMAQLHKQFSDWRLALAAYERGSASVKRAQKNSQSADFWSLPLSQSTKTDIAKLVALAQLVKYPDYYGLNLPPLTQ